MLLDLHEGHCMAHSAAREPGKFLLGGSGSGPAVSRSVYARRAVRALLCAPPWQCRTDDDRNKTARMLKERRRRLPLALPVRRIESNRIVRDRRRAPRQAARTLRSPMRGAARSQAVRLARPDRTVSCSRMPQPNAKIALKGAIALGFGVFRPGSAGPHLARRRARRTVHAQLGQGAAAGPLRRGRAPAVVRRLRTQHGARRAAGNLPHARTYVCMGACVRACMRACMHTYVDRQTGR